MPRESRRRWRALLPDRRAWPYLLTSPTSYMLLVSLLLTINGKLPVIRGFKDIEYWFSQWLLACMRDVAFFCGLAAVLALGESVRRWLLAVTLPLALAATAIAIINVGYMSISGEQITWPILTLGLQRFGDVSGIARVTILAHPLKLVVGLAIIVAPPFALRALLRRRGWPAPGPESALARAKAAGACAVVAILIALVFPMPRQYALARLYGNAVTRTYWGMTTGSGRWDNSQGGFFAGYKPHDLVDRTGVDAIAKGARPNVVLVILESVRRDETSLPGGTGRARTPNLEALAARGSDLTQARAIVTQTTKSVWSMLCARLPLLQTTNFESSSSIDVQCLPHVLSASGYRTAFFQSASGAFEDRARLVHQLGFAEFTASEHITGDIDGYLASDDGTLLPPFTQWIDDKKGMPFLATVLTSSTHHPYELSEARMAKLREAGAKVETDRDRYDRGIEIEDSLVGGIVAALAARGLTDNTIIVVVGDHGEGFGDTGAKQHGSNFYEEGLHVPFVMAGPGVPHAENAHTVGLFDITPTVLQLLGAKLTAEAQASTPARSVLEDLPETRVVPFSCYYDNAGRGFVTGHTKTVYVPETGQSFYYDLAADPNERDPKPLTTELRTTLESVQNMIEAHRASKWLLTKDAFDTYPKWKCREGQPCSPVNPLRR